MFKKRDKSKPAHVPTALEREQSAHASDVAQGQADLKTSRSETATSRLGASESLTAHNAAAQAAATIRARLQVAIFVCVLVIGGLIIALLNRSPDNTAADQAALAKVEAQRDASAQKLATVQSDDAAALAKVKADDAAALAKVKADDAAALKAQADTAAELVRAQQAATAPAVTPEQYEQPVVMPPLPNAIATAPTKPAPITAKPHHHRKPPSPNAATNAATKRLNLRQLAKMKRERHKITPHR